MTLMTDMSSTSSQPTGLDECSLKPLYGRYDGRDCGHIGGLIRHLGTADLQEIKAAHAELIVGCQCCCWEHDKRQMASLLRDC